MAFRLLQIALPGKHAEDLYEKLQDLEPNRIWRGPAHGDEETEQIYLVVHTTRQQEAMDAVSDALDGHDKWRMVVQSLEAVMPEAEDEDQIEEDEARSQVAAREEIFNQVSKQAVTNLDYLLMTGLATVVAAIGLNTNRIAIVIGAMVIAPLLGPILAFAFGTALGNLALLRTSAWSFVCGLGVSVVIGGGLGLVVPVNLESQLMDFSAPLGLTTLALPVASGAAAGLMVARGNVSALVGVMVAAALLPPVSAFGLLMGAGEWVQGLRALAVVGINVVAITLAAQLVFIAKGIRPREYFDDADRTSIWWNVGVLAALLVGAAAAVALI